MLSQTSYCLMTIYEEIKNNLPKFFRWFYTMPKFFVILWVFFNLRLKNSEIVAISCTCKAFSSCLFFVVFLARFYTVGLQQH